VVARSPEKRAHLASPEDVILAKLDWCRQGNEISDQQWRDITGIFKVKHGDLDLEYMQQTASEPGVADLLQRLI
jgi:hypothetical protein